MAQVWELGPRVLIPRRPRTKKRRHFLPNIRTRAYTKRRQPADLLGLECNRPKRLRTRECLARNPSARKNEMVVLESAQCGCPEKVIICLAFKENFMTTFRPSTRSFSASDARSHSA